MVKIRFDDPVDKEMIEFYCSWMKGNRDIFEKMMESYDFEDPEDISRLIDHFERTVRANQTKSHYLPEILLEITKSLPTNCRILLKDLWFKRLNYLLHKCYKYMYIYGLLYGKCIRLGIIDPGLSLELFEGLVNSDIHVFAAQPYSFIFQALFLCADILQSVNPERYLKLEHSLTACGFPIKFMSDNEFILCKSLTDESIPATCDYICLKNDDVEYLRNLAEDPSFSFDRNYIVPIWDLEYCLNTETSLSNAAIFFGAHKCYHYLQAFSTQKSSTPFAFTTTTRPFGRQIDEINIQQSFNIPKIKFMDLVHSQIVSQNFLLTQLNPTGYSICGGTWNIFHNTIDDGAHLLKYINCCIVYNRVGMLLQLLELYSISGDVVNIISLVLMNDNSVILSTLLDYQFKAMPSNTIIKAIQSLKIDIEINCLKELLFRFNDKVFEFIVQPYNRIPFYDHQILLRMFLKPSNIDILHALEASNPEELSNFLKKGKISIIFSEFSIEPTSKLFQEALGLTCYECFKMFIMIPKITEHEEFQWINPFQICVKNDRILFVEELIRLPNGVKGVDLKLALTNAVSVEMRNLIKSIKSDKN